jgi:AcrR family transcriptional regulator
VSRWTRRPAARPEEILDAALEVFLRSGYGPASMDEIARAAGISPGLIYRYFDGKEAVFRAVVQGTATRFIEKLLAQPLPLTADGADWRALLTHLARRAFDTMTRREIMGLLQLVLGEAPRMPELARIWYEEVIAHGQGRLIEILSAGMARGELRGIDPVVAARAFAGMLLICAMEKRVFGGSRRPHLNPDTLIDQMVTIYLDGLRVEEHS